MIISSSLSHEYYLLLIAITITITMAIIIIILIQIAHATVRKLSEVKGISEAKVTKLKSIVKGLVADMEFKTAADALADRKSIVTLTSGSVEIDKLLEGGIETGSITEVFGEFRTGKTQLCHTLCITCQMPLDSGGGEGKAMVRVFSMISPEVFVLCIPY